MLITPKAENKVNTAIACSVTCVALIAGLLAALSPRETSAEQLGGDIVVLDDLLSPTDFAFSQGRIYALDSEDRRVTVYARDGTLVRAFGREGEGPGEFQGIPESLDVYAHLVAVTEEYGRTSIFDTAGVFLNTFLTRQISHPTSTMRVLDDSLIFIGGLWRGGEEGFFDGTMGHIYTVDGLLKSAFMPMSFMARLYKSDLVFGATCDGDNNQMLWCGQVQDYVIRRYDYSGNKIDSFAVAPDYYRPLREDQPDVNILGRIRHWASTWDGLIELHSINDAILLSVVKVGGGDYKLDIIDKHTGSVLSTRDAAGWPAYVSREDQVLIIQHKATMDPLTQIEIVPVSTLLSAARE